MTNDLVNYYKFFEKLLTKVIKNFAKENVWAVEFRHIFGCIFDDDRKIISLDEELEIVNRVIEGI